MLSRFVPRVPCALFVITGLPAGCPPADGVAPTLDADRSLTASRLPGSFSGTGPEATACAACEAPGEGTEEDCHPERPSVAWGGEEPAPEPE